ncbi:MAG TPA: D-glycerate dehydrogenase [Myxococcota bacterium]|nr:D-glycerate dehydrogenase [Myxococcota bacterium]
MTALPRVLALHPLPAGVVTTLERDARVDFWDGAAPLAEVVARSDGLLCQLTDRIDAAVLEVAAGLRVVSSVSVGLDHVDLARATRLGIPVGHTPGVLVETTADLAFGLLLAAARRIAEGDRFVRSGAWSRVGAAPGGPGWSPDLLLGRDVHGATLGIVGLGEIGRAVARRAEGFGMRILGWSRSQREVPGVTPATLPALLEAADFVTVHVALTPETKGLLGRDQLARLRPGAIVVNTARGGIVDEDALVEALRAGRVAAAGLDVFAREPLPERSPLVTLENVVLTPHIGSASVETRRRMASLAVENVRAGLAGRRLPRCANPEVYETEAYRSRRQRARNASGDTT